MPLISPDVLAEARGLSPGVAGLFLAAGLLLWGLGWRWHRFWVVFGITLGAGVGGLSAGQTAGGQVMVAGVLVAVAAGMLALELAKLLAFITGGVAAWAAATAVVPQAQELWAVFLSGGLIGVVLYRFWAMLATSVAGALVGGHAGLVLGGELGRFDASEWAAGHPAALNGAVVALAVLGVVVQALTAPAEGADKSRDRSEAGAEGGHGGKDKNPKKPPVPEDDELEEGFRKRPAHGKPAHAWGLRLVPRFGRAA